ncbi:hypothetical protein CONLIGDRAFT_160101 [Coniochaeta ligniaria NRRL 30616]|uniref:Uncharacterized protein n=1 Tax=Coniochaeta ligniaria NRRL 30616 TaxID=1408157 RepID=A0A1J7JUB6_9PEZI|nr:hypothetical protein CONLIGDRAFT_160101 [Coniochaeta ligniaria NRRL 30616]
MGYSLKPSMLPMKRARTVEPQDEEESLFCEGDGMDINGKVTRATVGQVRLEWWVSKECGELWCKSNKLFESGIVAGAGCPSGKRNQLLVYYSPVVDIRGKDRRGGEWNGLTGQEKGVTGRGRMRKASMWCGRGSGTRQKRSEESQK